MSPFDLTRRPQDMSDLGSPFLSTLARQLPTEAKVDGPDAAGPSTVIVTCNAEASGSRLPLPTAPCSPQQAQIKVEPPLLSSLPELASPVASSSKTATDGQSTLVAAGTSSQRPTDPRQRSSNDSQSVTQAHAPSVSENVYLSPLIDFAPSPSGSSEVAYGPPRPPPLTKSRFTTSTGGNSTAVPPDVQPAVQPAVLPAVLPAVPPAVPPSVPREVLFALEQPVNRLPPPTQSPRQFFPSCVEEEQAFNVCHSPAPCQRDPAAGLLTDRVSVLAAIQEDVYLAVLARFWSQGEVSLAKVYLLPSRTCVALHP